MNTTKTKDWCCIDIDTIYRETKCHDCEYIWQSECIKKKIVDLFREEEAALINYLHQNDENT